MARLVHDWLDRELPDNVEIGPRSWLYSSYAFLHYRSNRICGVRIGADSGIYYGTLFELGPNGAVDIGDYCSIVSAIIHSNSNVRIDEYAFISHEVVISTSSFPVPGHWDDSELDISIGRNAWVGTRAILLGGTKLGEGAIIGAGAVVHGEIPPFAIAAGNPASVVGWARPKESRI